MLAQKLIIRQLVAGVLLLVFTFSITPKRFLHDAFARHKDKTAPVFSGNEPQVSYAGFICKCDNLVAESPFTDEIVYFDFASIQPSSVQKDTTLFHFYSSDFFFFKLRGPPANDKAMI